MSLLPDAIGLVEKIKKAAMDAFEASKPVNVYFGEVQFTNPLKINVEQKMLLGENQLILTRNVTDHETMVTVNWETEESLDKHSHIVKGKDSNNDDIDLTTDKKNLSHTHILSGSKQITIHNGLDVGDNVILIRQQGGQKFIVLDRIGVK